MYTNNTLVTSIVIITTALYSHAWAGAPNPDIVDRDGDGLIEIDSLKMLNQMRDDLTGQSLSGRNFGCEWVDGCVGYELTRDLNFDTNGDGKIDAKDEFWSDGKGWQPIGSAGKPFTAKFEGNGYVIKNLYINRPDEMQVGLWGYVEKSVITRLGITGDLTHVIGGLYTGILAGTLNDATLEGIFTSGIVESEVGPPGGITGYVYNQLGKIKAVFSSAQARYRYNNDEQWKEGFGFAAYYSQLEIESGWFSLPAGNNIISSPNGIYILGADSAQRNTYSQDQLACPIAANDSRCVPGVTLYKNWETEIDAEGQAYWDMGTKYQMPGLILNGRLHRDAIGNGKVVSAIPEIRAGSISGWELLGMFIGLSFYRCKSKKATLTFYHSKTITLKLL